MRVILVEDLCVPLSAEDFYESVDILGVVPGAVAGAFHVVVENTFAEAAGQEVGQAFISYVRHFFDALGVESVGDEIEPVFVFEDFLNTNFERSKIIQVFETK